MNATCSHFKILITGLWEKRKRAPTNLEDRGKRGVISTWRKKIKRTKWGKVFVIWSLNKGEFHL